MPMLRVRDIDMHYETHGRFDAEPLVLLHGFTGTGADFDPFISSLSEHYRLYIPDWRGHGRTTNPTANIIHAELARDTAAFAAALGLERAHFCGFSSGGMHLPFLALEHPSLVHSMILVSATYTFDDYAKAKVREARDSAGEEWIDSLNATHGETHGANYAQTLLDLWANSVFRADVRRASRQATGKVTGFIGELFGTVLAVKVANAEKNVIDHLHQINDERRRLSLRERLFNEILDSLFNNTSSLSTGAILLLAGHAIRSGSLSIGDFSLFVFLLQSMGDLTTFGGMLFARYRQLNVSIERMYRLMQGAPIEGLVESNPVDLHNVIKNKPEALPKLTYPRKSSFDRIETCVVRGLTYRYPNSENGVFDINLTIRSRFFLLLSLLSCRTNFC